MVILFRTHELIYTTSSLPHSSSHREKEDLKILINSDHRRHPEKTRCHQQSLEKRDFLSPFPLDRGFFSIRCRSHSSKKFCEHDQETQGHQNNFLVWYLRWPIISMHSPHLQHLATLELIEDAKMNRMKRKEKSQSITCSRQVLAVG
jgi:hypothetical protein